MSAAHGAWSKKRCWGRELTHAPLTGVVVKTRPAATKALPGLTQHRYIHFTHTIEDSLKDGCLPKCCWMCPNQVNVMLRPCSCLIICKDCLDDKQIKCCPAMGATHGRIELFYKLDMLSWRSLILFADPNAPILSLTSLTWTAPHDN